MPRSLWLLPWFFVWALAASVPYRNQVVVLTYHDVAKVVPPYTDTVSPATFRAQIQLLLHKGFRFITLSQLRAFLGQGGPRRPVPPGALLLVFDNGYRGIYRYALPLLRRERIPATVFLIASYVGRLANDLTWKEVRRMQASGVFSFGAETYNLHRAVAVSSTQTLPATVGRPLLPDGQPEPEPVYRRLVLRDLRRARRVITAATGQPVLAMVDPYGQYTSTFLRLAREAGYQDLFTTLGWPVLPGADPLRLTRLDVGVWNATPSSVLSQIRTVVAAAEAGRYQPPRRYVYAWP